MEHLIKSFMRVVRKLDDADELIRDFPIIERNALSDPSSVSEQNRRRILDFPEPEVQLANIAKCSMLSKGDLLQRATEFPGDLTESELDLLGKRYWLEITHVESRVRVNETETLLNISVDHWREVTEHLKKVRAPFYEPHEEKGLENAWTEGWRRIVDNTMLEYKQKVEADLQRAHPWVKQLWEEDQNQKSWGYAVFVDPQVDEGRKKEYYPRQHMALTSARGAVGCGNVICSTWLLDYLDWPIARSDTDELTTKFEKLREHFNSLRDQTSSSGLLDGIQRNVFLVIDSDCVNSVLDTPSVDDMWVWDVDPDYQANDAPSPEADEYRGYLRVRLQQLVHNFYNVRRFHAAEYSMKMLWEAAQKSKNQAFVSVEDAEARLWTLKRDIGSALP